MGMKKSDMEPILFVQWMKWKLKFLKNFLCGLQYTYAAVEISTQTYI